MFRSIIKLFEILVKMRLLHVNRSRISRWDSNISVVVRTMLFAGVVNTFDYQIFKKINLITLTFWTWVSSIIITHRTKKNAGFLKAHRSECVLIAFTWISNLILNFNPNRAAYNNQIYMGFTYVLYHFWLFHRTVFVRPFGHWT